MTSPLTTRSSSGTGTIVPATTPLGASRARVAPRGGQFVRRSLHWVAGGLSALVALYALVLLVVVRLRPPLMQERFALHPVATALHLAVGALVIVLAPLQLSERLRRRFVRLHRWLGRLYAVGVLASGTAGLALARISQGGLPAHLGFGLLAVLWIATTAIGVHRVRVGDIRAHERWMVRSFALTFAAVTLRIYIPLGVVLALPAELSYQVIAWLCWVPNLVVTEVLIRNRGVSIGDAGGTRMAARV